MEHDHVEPRYWRDDRPRSRGDNDLLGGQLFAANLEHEGRDEPCRLGGDVDPVLASMLDGTAVEGSMRPNTLARIAGQSTRSSVACSAPRAAGRRRRLCRVGGHDEHLRRDTAAVPTRPVETTGSTIRS